MQIQSLGWEDPLEEGRQPTPVFLPGEFHRQKSLVGYTVHGVAKSQTRLKQLSMLSRRKQWQPTPVLLPGESHGRRSLVGYSSWGRKESDTTERLHFTHFLLYHWRRKWQLTPVFLPGESHGQRSLAGHGPWGQRGSDTTEVTKQQHSDRWH